MAASVEPLHKQTVPGSLLRSLRLAAVFGGLLAVTILLQWLGNAYASEFGGWPDEAAHFTTGLMIRDYVAAGFPTSPTHYAEQYYLHYPKVAFGMWGPLLHVIEAAWMLVFPVNRFSVLLLMALISASTATLLYRALADEFGGALSLMAALLFVGAPRVQTYTSMVMADGLVAAMDFCAALFFGRYLDTKSWKHSAGFGAFACLSILAKGNGMALVFLPMFAIIFTRQFGLVKKWSLWIGPALIVVLAGPWQYYSAKALGPIADRQPGWVYLPAYTVAVITLVGLALFPVVALGVYDRVVAPAWRGCLVGKWASAAALICAFWTFHSLIPSVGLEQRYLIAIMPPALMFLIAGIGVIARWLPLPAVTLQRRAWGVAAIVLIVFLATGFSIPRKQYHGFDQVAEVLEKPEYKDSVILISSQADGEGMFITEMALREKRPSHIILRGTKMLGQSDWMGAHYVLLYHTPEEVMRFLASIPVNVVVIHHENGTGSFPHHPLLQQTIAAFPNAWEHIGAYPQPLTSGSQPNIDMYRLKSAAIQGGGKIRIELPYTLGHSIER